MNRPLYQPKIVEKPWGREVWYADQEKYAGKVLEVNAGARLSLQLHERKVETLYLLSGHVRLVFKAAATLAGSDVRIEEEDMFDWYPGEAVHIPARTIHRFEAVHDSVLLEVSTPDLTDVVRLQDDYARPRRDDVTRSEEEVGV